MSSCSCVYVDVDEPTRTISKKSTLSKTDHVCSECGRSIKRGETYERYKGVFDGSIFTNKTCMDCLSIRDEFFCSGWLWGEIISRTEEHVSEVGGHVSSECLLGLTKRARERILDMIDEYWEETDLEDGEE